ncbi:MAG: S9 family peptidase [Gammaproteobacteria bacterium]|nr:S9 family peptidase [Gammaproteobacteria bacterium]
MIKQFITIVSLATTLLISPCVAAQLLDIDKINVINAIKAQPIALLGDKSTVSTAFTTELQLNLAVQLSQVDNISVFGQSLTWQPMRDNQQDGLSVFKLPLQVNRFTQGRLSFLGIDNPTVFINQLAQKLDKNTLALALKNGDHQLMVMGQVTDPTKVQFDWVGDSDVDQLSFYNPLQRRVYPEQLYDSEIISQLSLAPDGKQILWTKKYYDPALGDKADSAISVMELRDYKSQQLLQRWQGTRPHSMAWSPDNKQLAFVEAGKISLLDRQTRIVTALTASLEDVSGLSWLDHNRLIFSWNKGADKSNQITKHYRALEDRWSGWRDNSQLYMVDVNSGVLAQLTDAKQSVWLLDTRDNTLLMSRELVDYQQPAHGLTELSELNLTTNKIKVLGQYRTLANAKYTSDGLYILAGPAFNNGLGLALTDGLIANNYDTQLYFRDHQSQLSALSKEFDPSIGQIKVLPNDDLMMLVTEQDAKQLYHFDRSEQTFHQLASSLEVIESFSVSATKQPTILYKGTSATRPQQVASIKLKSRQPRVLFDSESQSYSKSQLGQFKQWDFTNSRGEQIAGRYYLPPQFDATQKYPTLVYYYGGTSPVSRAFTGRYPFNLWAAQGYVVYVIQPTGATGFGQDFSAKHVNAWGKYTAQDIIESTKAFTLAHDFVNPQKIGNLGASYGGFMTMYLATKTDMFAASLSHAGISNLSNYWGYGWWGYAYSGVASAGSFPWNNQDLYVEQSPLYHADKINTPLLLIHGDSDTNVPVSESHSMYTALKLLGKEVDLIEFKGQNHTFNQRTVRLIWWDTTLAFFDKHLKDQPQWWNKLYPEQ